MESVNHACLLLSKYFQLTFLLTCMSKGGNRLNTKRGCAVFRSCFCITLKEQFPDLTITTWEILTDCQAILSSHHMLLVLFKMSTYLFILFWFFVLFFVFCQRNVGLPYLQLKLNQS